MNRMQQAGLFWLIASLLATLTGCTLQSIAAQQTKTSMLWDELITGTSYGQSFVSYSDGLYQINLATATYARTNTAPVIFHLRSSPDASDDIVTLTVVGEDIQNDRPTSFDFPPIGDSRGKTYYFFIESPLSAPGNAITVYGNEHDLYTEGVAYRDGQPVAGDLVFAAYSQQNATLLSILEQFVSRATRDIPFFLFYGVTFLVLGTVACLMDTKHGV